MTAADSPAPDGGALRASARVGQPHLRAYRRAERARAGAALDRLLRHLHPPKPARPPSTFGLSVAELEREAARLRGAGWSSDEVGAVLDRPERVSA